MLAGAGKLVQLAAVLRRHQNVVGLDAGQSRPDLTDAEGLVVAREDPSVRPNGDSPNVPEPCGGCGATITRCPADIAAAGDVADDAVGRHAAQSVAALIGHQHAVVGS